MADKIFLQILNMSFTASVVILFVLLARLFLKKAPKKFSYALWGIVLFRLCCPFSFESAVSLLPTKARPIAPDIVYALTPKIDTGIAAVNSAVNAVLPAATPYASVNPLQIWLFLGRLCWLAGLALLLCYSVVSLLRLKKRLRGAVRESGNVYLVQQLETPFVLGLFRPRIYLPASLSGEEKNYILLHEQQHIKRFDHAVKLLSFFVLCLHWFNPLVWAAFFVSGRDMEMACDEAVIKQLGNGVKKEYSASLFTLATGRRIIGGTPLAFGEGDTKGRVKNVLRYKKPAVWVTAAALAAVAAIGIGLAANPVNNAHAQPPKAEAGAETFANMQALWEARTQFAGDNSAVGRLIGLLPAPDGLQYDHFVLHTATPPYAVEIVYRVSNEVLRKYNTNEASGGSFEKNALLLLALVENAEEIRSTLTNGGNQKTQFNYEREWADKQVGRDVRSYAESPEKLRELIDFEQPAAGATAGTEALVNSYYHAAQSAHAFEILQSSMLEKLLRDNHWTSDDIVNAKWNYDSFTQYDILDQNMNSTSEQALYYCTFSDDGGRQFEMVLRYEASPEGGGLGKVRYSETPRCYDLRANIDDITQKLSETDIDLSTATASRVSLMNTEQNSAEEAIRITDGAGRTYMYYFDR